MALSISPAEIVAGGQYPLLTKAKHWTRVILGEVAVVQNGFPFKSELFDREQGVPLVRIRDIEETQTEHRYKGKYDPSYIVARGDLLIGMDGDFRAAKWRGSKALLNQRVCRLILKTNLFHPGFFFLTLQPYLNAINAESSSVTVKHLSSRTIEDIPLPFPPYEEQSRIVAKIEELFSELDASAESLTRARAQLKTYRQALLKAACEGNLTADWRAANAEKLKPAALLLATFQAERKALFSLRLQEWEDFDRAARDTPRGTRKPSEPRPLSARGSRQKATGFGRALSSGM